MLKMLIVDDENQIREGLRHILEWEEYNIEICGEASNGKEALEKIEQTHPDVVITDMKMPVMDGLELLAQVKDKYPWIKFVVLSGYDDFSLVRKAMKYGAFDYLLKPAGKNELIQILEELMDHQENKEDRQDLLQKEPQNVEEESISMAKSMLMNRIVTNSISAMEYHEKMDLLELSFGTGELAVAILDLDNIFDYQERASFSIKDVYMVCKKYLEENKLGIPFVSTAGAMAIVLTDVDASQMPLGLKAQLEQLLAQIQEAGFPQMYFAVSRAVKSYRNLPLAYQEAKDTLRYKYIFEEGMVLFAEEIREYFKNREVEKQHVSSEQVEKLIIGNNMDQNPMEYIEQILGEAGEESGYADFYVLRNKAMEVVFFLYQFLLTQFSTDQAKIMKEKDSAMHKIAEIRSRHEMKRFLMTQFANASAMYQAKQNPGYSKIIVDMLKYVKEHYDNINLSLQFLADEYGANSAYLGRLFRKETGTGFTDYLNIYRVEQAKKLLKETNLKGVDLSEKVGFSNYNYFYIVFKKITGQKPMEIRNIK
ncbi:MAG: response regulator [Lachnospiraceae bacterium]